MYEMKVSDWQHQAAECHLRASTWMQPHWFTEKAGRNAVIREQLLGAYHSAQARKGLEVENALRAIEICLQG